MGAVLILTGRVHRVLEKTIDQLSQAYARGKRCILIVPEQFTLQAEVEVLSRLNLPGFFDIEVLSPTRLQTRVFERAGAPARVRIDERGKQMVLSESIHALENDLVFYKGAAQSIGFVEKMGALIADFKRGALTPEAVAALALAQEEETLALKLRDAAAIFDRYEQQMDGRFVDGEDVQREMLSRLEASTVLKDSYVYIYGFDMITPQFAEQMARMSRCADALTLALEVDVSACRDASVYKSVNGSLARFMALLEREGITFARQALESPLESSEDIQVLERELFSYPVHRSAKAVHSVRLLEASTPYAEVHEVAARIRLLCMKKDMPYAQMAVVYSDGALYAPLIAQVFPLYDIPFYLDEKRAASHHPLIRFLLSSLRAVTRGYRLQDVIDCARTLYTGITFAQCDALENYARAYGIRGNMWKKPFIFGEETDLAVAEAARETLVAPLVQLERGLAQAKCASETVEAIYTFLMQLGADRTLDADRKRLAEAGLIVEASDCAQIWKTLMETLDQLHTLLGSARGSAQTVLRMLEAGLCAVELAGLPSEAGAMVCGQIGHVRSGSVEALFLLGANDGLGVSRDASLLEDAQRLHTAREAGVYLGMSEEERAQLAQLDILKSLTAPKRFLHVSFAGADAVGGALRPASLIARMQRVFSTLQVEGGAMRGGDEAPLCAPRAALGAIGPRLREAYDGSSQMLTSSWRSAYAFLASEPVLRTQLSSTVRNLTARRVKPSLSKLEARALYGRNTMSVSRLERFASCPYRHFVDYGLRPQKRREYGVNRGEVGEVYHQAIDAYTREVMGVSEWPNVTREQSDEMMDRVSAPLLDAWANTPLGQSARGQAIKRRMNSTARRAGWALTSQMRTSAFRTERTEAIFGKGNIPPIEIGLPDGTSVYLQGRIDRIDLFETGESVYLRVVDYKSGNATLDPTRVYWGLSLQLLIYLEAAQRIYKGAKPAGLFYCKIEDPMIRTDSRITQEVEKQIAKVLSLKGIALSEVEIIRAQGEDMAAAMLKKDGSLDARAKAEGEEELSLLVGYAMRLAGALSGRIVSGEIAISPAEQGQWRSCQSCEYMDICGFDAGVGDRTRRLEPKTLADAQQQERLDKERESK